jgi:hypothetical protein
MGDVSVALGGRKIHKGLAAHEANGKNGNNRCWGGAPDDPRVDQLLVAKKLRRARNLRFGEDAL